MYSISILLCFIGIFQCLIQKTYATTIIEEYTEETFQSMSVKQLSSFISDRGEVCKHCTDKPEFVQLAYSLKHTSIVTVISDEDQKDQKVEDEDEVKNIKETIAPDVIEYTEDSFKTMTVSLYIYIYIYINHSDRVNCIFIIT